MESRTAGERLAPVRSPGGSPVPRGELASYGVYAGMAEAKPRPRREGVSRTSLRREVRIVTVHRAALKATMPYRAMRGRRLETRRARTIDDPGGAPPALLAVGSRAVFAQQRRGDG